MLMPMGFYAIKVTQWHSFVRRSNLQLDFLECITRPQSTVFWYELLYLEASKLNPYEKVFCVSLRRFCNDVELMCCPRPRLKSASWSGEEDGRAWSSKKGNR